MRNASVSFLKAHLSAELKAVQAGETVVVMDRDHPVARLVSLDYGKGSEVRKPKMSFGYEHHSPLMSGDSLAPLYEDRSRR